MILIFSYIYGDFDDFDDVTDKSDKIFNLCPKSNPIDYHYAWDKGPGYLLSKKLVLASISIFSSPRFWRILGFSDNDTFFKMTSCRQNHQISTSKYIQ